MRDFRKSRRSWAPLGFAAILGLWGCRGPQASGLRFVSATARQDGGLYSVMALLRNSDERPVYLDTVCVEMTTYGEGGKVLASGYPFTFDGTIGANSTTRLPLNRPDREKLVRTSKLFLKDLGGRLLTEVEVGPIAEAEGEARKDGTASRSDPAAEPPLELKILGAPE